MWNLNINNLMLINFHISLITKRFIRSFDRHSDKTVTLSELLPSINKLRNKILNFFHKVSRMWLLNCSSYCDTCIEPHLVFQEMHSSEFIPFFFNGSQNWVHLPIFFYTLATPVVPDRLTTALVCPRFGGPRSYTCSTCMPIFQWSQVVYLQHWSRIIKIIYNLVSHCLACNSSHNVVNYAIGIMEAFQI